MKKILLMLCFFIIASVSVSFAAPGLTWDVAPASENVDLYQVEVDGVIVADVIPNTFGLISLADGSHIARVRAHNVWGWGDFSAPLDFDKGVPGATTGVIIQDIP